ncbi:unnamed protein product [Caenorhabditis bovis]|uniref:Uncharacterized protein n=1 Tax=Caenorhabditis bovis TaxID=2654633 RepID=A0A8S1F4Q6_9PELO|nr:unnamed protein product [Caenorhabditis bovis]
MESYSSPDIDEKLALLHMEMASLSVECDRLLNKHLIVEKTLSQSCTAWPNGAADTSSAYNTGGESCRSVSVTPDTTFIRANSISQPQKSPRGLRRTTKLPSPAVQRKSQKLPIVVLPHDDKPVPVINNNGQIDDSKASCSKCSVFKAPKSVIGALKGTSLRKISIAKNLVSSSSAAPPPPPPPPTTDAVEYAKRFRIPSYSVVLKDETTRKSSFRFAIPQYFRTTRTKPTSFVVDTLPDDEIEEVVDEEKMASKDIADTAIHYKWKIKRRCDGSRYIVKRPIRSQILKKREAQLYRERAPISTDDDAMSELKLGRFHTREERKRILEREKLKKTLKMQQKMVERAHPSEQAILQISQQKMAREKDNMIYDEFVTTREVLSSRTRPGGIHGIVSITTV